MARRLTIGQKIAGGLGSLAAITVLAGAIAVYALHRVVSAENQLIDQDVQSLIDTRELMFVLESKVAFGRGFLISLNEEYRDKVRAQRSTFSRILLRMRDQSDTRSVQEFVEEMTSLEREHQQELDAALDLRRSNVPMSEVVARFDQRLVKLHDEMLNRQLAFVTQQERQVQESKKMVEGIVQAATLQVIAIAVASVVIAMLVAVLLSRGLARQIGTAVHHIQTSSTQLQSATTEQAAGTKEQTSAITEVSATLKELVSTARQMMENSQGVARVAAEATGVARGGEITVQRAQDAVNAIRKQVDLIVGHMLDLGKKSQQIGLILEIINELAEQTNILAINATIESAGAGEHGKRFAAVAEEIRKLADRVGGSSKEIRVLIDEIRAASNTTVMATEDGSKAVDAGSRQFDDVAQLFLRIAAMVETTTDASREIELGTKQQVSAVEQVNAALTGVAQAAKDAEVTTRQTLETATQLAQLSLSLSALVQVHAMPS